MLLWQGSSTASRQGLEAAAAELHSLQRLTMQRASVAIAAAALVVPLAGLNMRLAFAVGVGSAAEGILAVVVKGRRHDLLLDLASKPTAYELADVRRFGVRLASLKQRRAMARAMGALLRDPGWPHSLYAVDRVAAVAPRLAAVEEALSDSTIEIEPVAMATLLQLLTNGETSPLLNPAVAAEELERIVAAVLSGIRPRGAREDGKLR